MNSIFLIVLLFIDLKISSSSPIHDTGNKLNWDVIVETSNGKVRGNLQKSPILDINFYAFQSIPYAQPPTGNRRFRDPIAVSNWSGVLDATITPKACAQPMDNVHDMSEDCLFLNVYIPSPRPTKLLPVIFWIHGGFFISGSGKLANYRPDFFVNNDVILVTINYRLGIFGYLSAEDDILPGNYATKDQLLALKWVNNNIDKFGGDPTKITLMGQSAGAASVGFLLQSPLSKGLFSAAILHSGNTLNLWARSKNAKTLTKEVANVFNIKHNNTQDLINGLQKLEWNELNIIYFIDAILYTALHNPLNGFPFGPVTETNLDGVVAENLHEKLRTGDFNRVPVMTGFNSGEGNMLIPLYDLAPFYLWLYDILPQDLVPVDMNAESKLLNPIGKEVKNFYFGTSSLAASKQLFVNFISDNEFIRPANEFVRLLSRYTDTYFYRFSYEGQLPVIAKTQRELPGVTHTEELQYLFYSSDENPASSADVVTRKRLVKLWTNFAKYHNPTPCVDPLFQNITWKPVQKDKINYLNIGTDLELLKNPSERNVGFWKSIYDNYGYPPFDTY